MFLKPLKAKLVVLAGLLVGMVGTANAIPLLWLDHAGDLGTKVRDGDSYWYQHSLDGFNPTTDTILGATLSILLTDDDLADTFLGDDNPWGDGKEYVKFNFDGSGWTPASEVGVLDLFSFNVTSLLTDGILNVVIKATKGDFLFKGSLLTAWGHRSTKHAVPEPATLTLLGFGLLAAGFAARRRNAS